MSTMRLVPKGELRRYEMAAACVRVGPTDDPPLLGWMCGPAGQEVYTSGTCVADIEESLRASLRKYPDAFGAVVTYQDGPTRVRLSRILPD